MSDGTIALFLASAVRLAGPILLPALGEVVSERAGVFNVGLEGMMLFGAFGAAAGADATNSAIIGALIGGASGAAAGALLGFLVARLRADQIVAGIGLNLLALGVTSFLRTEFLGGSTSPVSAGVLKPLALPLLSDLPLVGASLFNQSPLIYVAVLGAFVLWIFIRSTRPGLVLRSVGERAVAADSAGVNVVKVRLLAVVFTGFMAGLGGAYLCIVQTGGVFIDNMTGGRGYLAIAVAIFGRWQPLWVCAAALLFGAADALQYQGQNLGLSVPTAILLMFPFALALLTWVLLGRSKAAPADLGRPFIRGSG
ncbi:ABC transporter permease [soil metagenome]